jgi:UDP-glucose 4-epimerase
MDKGHRVTAAVRKPLVQGIPGGHTCLVGDLLPETDWRQCLERQDVVIHAAARVHVMHDSTSDPLAEYRLTNVEGTLRLARQAAESGVRRFIFISSIKVNGEGTTPSRPYRSGDQPAPADPYAVSKWEAEEGLFHLSRSTPMEVAIIRSPLVYGPGVKANFLSMMRWINKGIPLPLGSVDNLRSMVCIDNLCDLISLCVEHPGARNKTFLASDGEDLSTTDLLRRLASALGRPAHLFPVAPAILAFAAAAVGKPSIAQRLCGTLQVDISETRSLLGWEPPVTVDAGLRRTADDFLERFA